VRVQHGLDVVPVRVEEVGAEVTLVVLRTVARMSIVGSAGLQARRVEGAHLVLIRGAERKVNCGMVLAGHRYGDPEVTSGISSRRLALLGRGHAQSDRTLVLAQNPIAQRCQRLLVEATTASKIANGKINVIDHACHARMTVSHRMSRAPEL